MLAREHCSSSGGTSFSREAHCTSVLRRWFIASDSLRCKGRRQSTQENQVNHGLCRKGCIKEELWPIVAANAKHYTRC